MDFLHNTLSFNPIVPRMLHLDINSCFATIEQQYNPLYRGKCLVVAAYVGPSGCVLAASIDAKKYGVKTGMRVKDARLLCPSLVVLPPDPPKYRFVHRKLKELLLEYTPFVTPKSIDEFVMDFSKSKFAGELFPVGREIKARIREEIGEYISVSIGIGPNRFLAKLASNLKKPDGLSLIENGNHREVYSKLVLTDLCGISFANEARLKGCGINNVLEFYEAPLFLLKAAFRSVTSWYWYLRLRGYEVDDFSITRRSFGNSYAMPGSRGGIEELLPILTKLVAKTGVRMRRANYEAFGVHVGLSFKPYGYLHKGISFPQPFFSDSDIYKAAYNILSGFDLKSPARILSVTCFNLREKSATQLSLFEDVLKKQNLVKAIDSINSTYGEFSLAPWGVHGSATAAPDSIAFGNVREL